MEAEAAQELNASQGHRFLDSGRMVTLIAEGGLFAADAQEAMVGDGGFRTYEPEGKLMC